MLFYLAFSVVVAGVVLPSPQQAILAQALVARDGLSNEYHLKMSITRSVNGEANKEVSTVEVWSKGSLLRFDQLKHESAVDPAHVGRRRICCRNCERKGYHITTRQGRSSHAVAMVEFYPLGTHESEWFRLDWTRLGQFHGYSIDYTREPADTYLRHAFETKGEVSEVTHAGQRCYVVQIVMENGSTRRCYFCPAFGMNPVFYVDRLVAQ